MVFEAFTVRKVLYHPMFSKVLIRVLWPIRAEDIHKPIQRLNIYIYIHTVWYYLDFVEPLVRLAKGCVERAVRKSSPTTFTSNSDLY